MLRRFAAACFLVSVSAQAYSGGITGRSGKSPGVSCASCHDQSGAPASASLCWSNGAGVCQTDTPTVTSGGYTYLTLSLRGGPAVAGGMNVAATSGEFIYSEGSSKLVGDEVTHAQPKKFVDGGVSWLIRWKAGDAGTAGFFAMAQSVNLDGGTTGDRQASATLSMTVLPPNIAPTVAMAARATPATLAGTTTTLAALGADENGEAALTYTWSRTAGPAPVTFAATNGTNAAKSLLATFGLPGAYTFQVVIRDASGATVTSAVNVTVNQTYSSVRMTPPSATLPLGGQLTLAAIGRNQFGGDMAVSGAFTWATTGGTITAAGLLTAPTTIGTFNVTASNGGKSGTTVITTVVGSPPTIAVPAATTVAGPTSLNLTVLGSDDGSEPALKYTWAVNSGPNGATFSRNGTNAAKQTVVTLTSAGTYTFTVTARDGSGLSTTSAVTRAVAQAFTSVLVMPASATLVPETTKQFTASPRDQFGAAMTMGTAVSWLATGGGWVDSGGLFHAGSALGGPFSLRAELNGKISSANVTVSNGGVPVWADAPTATPGVVTGRTSLLRVRADDDKGENALRYTWSVVDGPGPVSFSPNATNAAKVSTATFQKPGVYSLEVEVIDADGKSATQSLELTVEAVADSMAVTPGFVAIKPGTTQAFTAEVVDQFGGTLSPTTPVTWSAGTAGAISDNGVLTARSSGGTFNITATSDAMRGSAMVLIDAEAPAVSLAEPVNGAEVTGSVKLAADISDNHVVAEVRFLVDDKVIATLERPPYEATWSSEGASFGGHALQIQAEDSAGNVGTFKGQLNVGTGSSGSGRGCSVGFTLAPFALAAWALRRRRRTSEAAVSCARHPACTSSRVGLVQPTVTRCGTVPATDARQEVVE